MKLFGYSCLFLAFLLSLSISPAFAGSDEYLGDANIYAGVPTTASRPNVLFIIDNSRATLHEASGSAYEPWLYDSEDNVTGPNVYPQKAGCDGDEDARNGCYLSWNIYTIDNQGDFTKTLFSNSSEVLENLECDPSDDNSNPLLDIFQTYGTYSGSGISPYPNLDGDGECDWKNNNSSGEVYALGNYLNYAGSAEGDDRIGAPDPSDGVVDPAAEVCTPADVVSIEICPQEKYFNDGSCKKPATGYFECTEDHTSSADNSPLNGEASFYPWDYLGASAPSGATVTAWAVGNDYKAEYCETPEGEDPPAEDEEPVVLGDTQREIIFHALEMVIGSTAGLVNFGALSYGNNNQGAALLYDMSDLAANLEVDSDSSVAAPDCTDSSNDELEFCKFLAHLPGPGEDDGEPVLSSNTLRPQAEALLDAGYYYGANYTPVNNIGRIPEDMENECGRNHIILLTNGFTNGDGSPRLNVVGDADGDEYDNEEVYGLGSHWLDDVAKYLVEHYKIKTHVVLAFQTADDLLENAAKDGEGQFYNVFNAQELSAALTKLLANIINEASTSFVAPVVPASTTNRTISSNKVYLGLFRPQEEGAWHGNVKKYGLSLDTYQLTGYDGSPATDPYGNFDDDSISYWSIASNGMIPSVTDEDDDPDANDYGYVDPDGTNPNKPKGDGGEVDVGGTGGVLLEKVRNLTAAIRTSGWAQSSVSWRKIYTYLMPSNSDVSTAKSALTDPQNLFMETNSNVTYNTLGLDGATASAALDRANVIFYAHGFESFNGPSYPSGEAQARSWVLGDILHSRPLVINYSKYPETVENVCSPAEEGDAYNSSVIFAGANDGMLHAFRDCDGEELWAFIPPNALPYLQYVRTPQAGHPTFVDSAPSLLLHDQNEDGTIDPAEDKAVLVFGQRRGGGTNFIDDDNPRGAYYALDVTDPTSPVLLWELDSDDLDELGETWSQPRLAKVKVDDTTFKVVAFIGAGYDNNEDLRYGNTQLFPDSTGVNINDASAGGTVDGAGPPLVSSGSLDADSRNNERGRGLVAIEIADMTRANVTSPYLPTVTPAADNNIGKVFWDYLAEDHSDLKYSFASDLTVLDLDGDSFADSIYVGDTGGNLWRFKVSDLTPTNWTGTILFKSNEGAADSSVGRKIFYRPAVAYIGAPHIYFGTGDREHPLNISTEDRMYCVIDWGDDGTYPINESDLEDVTLNTIQDKDTTAEDAQEILDSLYSTPASNPDDFTYGWFIKMDGGDRDAFGDPGEKILAPPTIFNGVAYFSTYQLIIGPQSGCDGGNLGISRLYELNFKTGEAVQNFDTDNDLTIDEVWDGDGKTLINDRAIGGTDGEILQRSDRVRRLGEGIPSGIVTIIDASGRVTQLISSSDKVEASGVADVKLISPVYYMQW